MRALLLAAGLGTRLRPVTDGIPKCLVPIGGRPLLDIWLELLLSTGGIERVLINTHYLADAVRTYLHASTWKERVDLVQEPQLLGTGGTVLANRTYFGSEAFLVAHADNLTDFNPKDLVARHLARPSGIEITLLAFRTDTPHSCGILELANDGRVVAFHEKVAHPPGNLASAAVYVFEPNVVEAIAALSRPIVDLSTEILPKFMNRILAVEHPGYHRDIGTLESLRIAEADMVAQRIHISPSSTGMKAR